MPTSKVILIIAIFLLSQFIACAPESENMSKTVLPPDLHMGDWQGIQKSSNNEENPLVAQVIAYAEGKYVANLLKQFDTRDPKIVVLEGKRQNDKIVFSGKSDTGIDWQGTIIKDTFYGEFSGTSEGTFQMNKVVRLSPALGKTAPNDAVILFDGTNLDKWEHQRDGTGYLNLSRHMDDTHCSAYLNTEIWSDIAQEVVFELGSNDGIKAWLNGDVILSNNILRGASPAQDKIDVTLQRGWNSVMLRITNAGGSWGAYARFVDNDGNPLMTISEKESNETEGKSKVNLENNDHYLMNWKVAGPYKKEGLEAEELFEISFAPEITENTNVQWGNIDFINVDYSPKWKIIDGTMEVLPASGSLITKQKFTDYQLHLEFRSPFMPYDIEQSRGNSGVYNQGRYEVQVLDSYGLEGADNECGGIYKIARPLVNMCAPPGQWQTYDITFKAPRLADKGEKVENVRLTVIHNGKLIHDNIEIPVTTGGAIDNKLNRSGILLLQDHGDRVQYRNIWLIENTE